MFYLYWIFGLTLAIVVSIKVSAKLDKQEEQA
ncbi:MAG: cytochrome bd oxidase small subunit, CydX/CbdX family [Duodenibacillus sp.]|nr:cytochrome bd oxidase small subunit, CydX/CbdX family [Duodenibacillus sp.]